MGQISNAALARSVIAYNENSQAEERQQAREEVETLAILTGLEIDSAKSGVKPDLSPYLGKPRKQKNLFLTYKYLVEGKAEKRKGAWSLRQTGQGLPPLHRLGAGRRQSGAAAPIWPGSWKSTPPSCGSPPSRTRCCSALPKTPQWKEKLPQASLKLVEEMILEYQRCLGRIRVSMAPVREQPHRTGCRAHPVRPGPGGAGDGGGAVRRLLRPGAGTGGCPAGTNPEQAWQFLPPRERENFLREHLPADIVDAFGELLCDFRAGGYRILGDLLLDVERENRLETSRQLHRAGDSEQMEEMLESYENKTAQESYREGRPGAAASTWSGTSSPSWRCSAPQRWENGASCGTCCWTRFWPPLERRSAVIDEKAEFAAYTGAVVYDATNKQDSAYLGRFTFDTLLRGEGMQRILTILARGYLWQSDRPDIEQARGALRAWCSIPDSKKAKPKEAWQYETDFRQLHEAFPELVNEQGQRLVYPARPRCAGFSQTPPGKGEQAPLSKTWNRSPTAGTGIGGTK